MPRVARIVFPSMPYHIISRGNNQEKVFQQEEDFEKYLEITVFICSSRQKKTVFYPRSCREFIWLIPFGLAGRRV